MLGWPLRDISSFKVTRLHSRDLEAEEKGAKQAGCEQVMHCALVAVSRSACVSRLSIFCPPLLTWGMSSSKLVGMQKNGHPYTSNMILFMSPSSFSGMRQSCALSMTDKVHECDGRSC